MLITTHLQPFQKDVIDYKPNMDNLNKLGHNFDAVVREVEQSAYKQPHSRSTQVGDKKKDTGRDVTRQRQDLDRSGMLDQGKILLFPPGSSLLSLENPQQKLIRW